MYGTGRRGEEPENGGTEPGSGGGTGKWGMEPEGGGRNRKMGDGTISWGRKRKWGTGAVNWEVWMEIRKCKLESGTVRGNWEPEL